MSEFKFTAAAVPQTPVEVETHPVVPSPPRSDAERITEARAVAIQRSRESNAMTNLFGRHLPHSYYEDFGFGSAWFAHHIYFLASDILKTACEGTRLPLAESDRFDLRTGMFDGIRLASGETFSISDLMKLYSERIRELGISEARLEEWAARLSSWQEDHAFYNLSFEEKMAKFKEPR
jgi:hypothetical protein